MLKTARLIVLICSILFQAAISPAQARPTLSKDNGPVASIGVNRTASRLATRDRQIPGLYDSQDEIITPIQGQEQFNALVLSLGIENPNSSDCSLDVIREAGRGETVSLVQYYMATCPDCQGFSPYFKRFSRDIGPHWRRLVRLYTVNCNDFQNIHLCQEQNPRLIVPMVRWYSLPIIQRDARLKLCNLTSKQDTLSLAHRQFIDEQRRDLISLRRATLRFIALMLDELSMSHAANVELATDMREKRMRLYESLPIHWHQLNQLASNESSRHDWITEFNMATRGRAGRCRQQVGAGNGTIYNYVLLEPVRSFIGRTLIADWSNYTCTLNQTSASVLIHRTSNYNLLDHFNVTDMPEDYKRGEILLLHADLDSDDELPRLTFLASNQTEVANRLRKRHADEQTSRAERIHQRASLERYYSHLGAAIDKQPIRYAAAMSSSSRKHMSRKRDTIVASTSVAETSAQEPASGDKTNKTTAPAAHPKTTGFENANWTPESAYPNEERLRYQLNRLIATRLNMTSTDQWPSAFLNATHPGKIHRPPLSSHNGTKIEPARDDLNLMYLTDYYKGLDEIVHIDMLAKAEVDGFQLLASCNFLRDLGRHFPFQGNALTSNRIGSKSIARYYLTLLQHGWLNELNKKLVEANSNQSHFIDRNLVGSPARDSISAKHLERVRVSGRKLEEISANLKKTRDVGLPPERHLKWNYCAGSSNYLRGHTCSLWVLFHTLTVHEYLGSPLAAERALAAEGDEDRAGLEYEFQIDYSKPPKRACNPANPDEAYLSARTQDLYLNSTNFVLANVINFVRFYLPCTNCAAHFSCMVEHSPGLRFAGPGESVATDSHLLWLWEGHNRVNERTRGTHSEDPMRPKHVFPHYDACPECYLEQPKANDTFTSMRFHRAELVKFIVARYRKSAILNNKINIEELYKKT